MTPTRVDILGEDYFLIFHSGTDAEASPHSFDGVTVSLTPSLTEDFCVRPYFHSRELRTDKAAAVAAAAHLTLVRGLPLSDFDFETPHGIDRVFHTGNGIFALTIQKCKVLFTTTAEICGCRIRYTDVLLDRVYRVVHAESLSFVDKEVLMTLVSKGRYLPEAVLFTSVESGVISILPYTDFNPEPPSRLMLFCAAAFSYRGKERGLSACGGRLTAEIGSSTVNLNVKCEIK